ncbi:hypothetical protein O3G_MSEX010749 [Manduca sexta]|uniref:Uncharacterized protein n=1 Tax=Manduca sexta TaxID=7130 RepID=A0A921ZI62_MANSE|nr:hypothetical protein O3G_MSEX010749 [Manduca sexta]KAG6458237.1 hypothetical protein O3G_MSEX010749 [Manduca sexta]
MPRESKDDNCNALARIIKDFCSCSENGTWSPEMTSDKRKSPFLKSELTNMSTMRRRIMTLAKRKKSTPQPPKLSYDMEKIEKNSETLTSNLVNTTISSQSSTIRRNIDNFLLSRRMFALEEDIYETPIQHAKNSNCGENWSLSKAWRVNNNDFFNRPPIDSLKPIERLHYLERIDEVPRRKKRNKKLKEQLRYDRNIKRHIRIRVMLSLRMRRYMKKRLRKPTLNSTQTIVPPRRFPRGGSVSSFGTRSYRSVMTDKMADGSVLFDVHEARNSTMELCHDYQEDLDTLEIALRAGNFRSGRLAVEGWWCGRAMPAAGGRANNGALALHYAAARGCLDCVRLLTNTTPDVS